MSRTRWSRRDWLYVLVPVASMLSVSAWYLVTHPYPALGGGLYLTIAETVSSNGYALPTRIPHYTSGGIPFGYPPLMFYVAAALLDAGVPKLLFVRAFPAVTLTVVAVVYTWFATEILDDVPRSAVAATVAVTSPAVLQYTLTAGGFVRATGLLLVVVGLVTGIRAFRDESWRYTLLSTLVFALVLVTHLKYTLFLGTSFVVFWAYFDRTASGLLRGLCVASGGLLVTAPWWLTVLSNHGVDIFLVASDTHGGIGNPSIRGFLDTSDQPLPTLWPALSVVSFVYLVSRRKLLLPLWFLTVGIVVGNHEHMMLVGGLMISTLLSEGLRPSILDDERCLGRTFLPDEVKEFSTNSIPVVLFVGSLLLYSGVSATWYVGSHGSSGGIVFADEDDITAMEWAEQNTRQNASFVVVGDVAEWFPHYSQRTSLVAGRGSEWTGQYQLMTDIRYELSNCLSAECVTGVLTRSGLQPEYIYVARDGYMIFNNRRLMERRWQTLRPSMMQSSRYERVYRNDGAIIFRYTGPADNTGVRPVQSNRGSLRVPSTSPAWKQCSRNI